MVECMNCNVELEDERDQVICHACGELVCEECYDARHSEIFYG